MENYYLDPNVFICNLLVVWSWLIMMSWTLQLYFINFCDAVRNVKNIWKYVYDRIRKLLRHLFRLSTVHNFLTRFEGKRKATLTVDTDLVPVSWLQILSTMVLSEGDQRLGYEKTPSIVLRVIPVSTVEVSGLFCGNTSY